MMEDPLMSRSYPPASLWKQYEAQPFSVWSADAIPISTSPPSLKKYLGEEQPPPDERLGQVKIFLADEDVHRNLNFRVKLNEIERYIEFLDRNHYKADGDPENRLLTCVKEMIRVHKDWVRKTLEVPSMAFGTGRFAHQNRLVHMIKDPQKVKEILNTKAPELTRNLAWDSAPALHKCIGEKDQPPSPDPFCYTKQVADVRRQQETLARKLRGRSLARNFNGPYILLPSERRLLAEGDQAQRSHVGSAVREFNKRVSAAVASIIDIAQPLDPEAELTEVHAAHLLQKQILAEHNNNWGTRTPNHSTLWAFADPDEKPKAFFSLDRWPLELQSPQQASKIRRSGPKPYTWVKPASRPKVEKIVSSDPNERYVAGETFFPFGETRFQAARQSQMINSLLANVPQFAHLYTAGEKGKEGTSAPTPVDFLALPPLPEDHPLAYQKVSGEDSDSKGTDGDELHTAASGSPPTKRRRLV